MPEKEYLDTILETESIAEKIEYDAKSARKELISRAKDEADDIIAKSKKNAETKFREAVRKLKDEAEKYLAESNNNAAVKADELSRSAEAKKDEAILKVAERIIGYCVNR
jgi:vacuolar-type H+-ATPase subunit H